MESIIENIKTKADSNQARINALDSAARSRNNAVYMTFYFCNGALGSLSSTFLWGLFE